MKAMLYIFLSVLTMVSSYGQVVHNDSIQTIEGDSRDSSFIVQSQQNREVNKRFDEDGKIIGFDSIQIYSLSKGEKLPVTMDMDSLLNAKGVFSKNNYSWNMEDQGFQDFFGTDSVFSGNRLLQEFFKQQGKDNFSGFESLLQQIDSLQQLMMEKQPDIPLIPREN